MLPSSMRQRLVDIACIPLGVVGRAWNKLSPRSGALVFCYHGVVGARPDGLAGIPYRHVHCPLRLFERQISFLVDHFPIVTVGEIVDCLEAGAPIPRNAVALTFDDAYRNIYHTAWPVLKRRGTRATLFVTAGLMGTTGLHWPDEVARVISALTVPEIRLDLGGKGPLIFSLPLARMRHEVAVQIIYALKALPDQQRRRAVAQLQSLRPKAHGECIGAMVCSPQQLREMCAEGMEIGSHTMTHPILPHVEQDDDLRWELETSRAALEATVGTPIDLLAYPDGAYDQRVVAAAREAGYRAAVTTEPCEIRSAGDAMLLGRTAAARSVGRFVVAATGLEGRLRRVLNRYRVGQVASSRQAQPDGPGCDA